MPAPRTENPYPGINAHHNSQLQQQGDWPDFHTNHISDLERELKAVLLPMGYTVGAEQSLQIWRLDQPPTYRKSDLTIYAEGKPQTSTSLQGGSPTAAAVFPIPELLAEETIQHYKALVVYHRDTGRGDPVAWIELLSPTNKPPASGFENYRSNRDDILQAGLVYVEIDYLHQQPPTFPRLPDYSKQEKDAAPYLVTVMNPIPDVKSGKAHVYKFVVGEAMPIITIPLRNNDKIYFDIGKAYNNTFTGLLYGLELDYSQPPANFETYSTADRETIRAVMDKIAAEE